MTKATLTLRDLRRQILEKTQKAFAQDLGVSIRTYIRYEQHGAPRPILLLASRIAQEHMKGKKHAKV